MTREREFWTPTERAAFRVVLSLGVVALVLSLLLVVCVVFGMLASMVTEVAT